MPDMNENAETQQEYFGRANVGRMNIEEREKTILLQQLSDREKRIIELERKLEQTEKDLTDYQFNYPKIKDLEKENAELKEHIKADCIDCVDYIKNQKLEKQIEKMKCCMNCRHSEEDNKSSTICDECFELCYWEMKE